MREKEREIRNRKKEKEREIEKGRKGKRKVLSSFSIYQQYAYKQIDRIHAIFYNF